MMLVSDTCFNLQKINNLTMKALMHCKVKQYAYISIRDQLIGLLYELVKMTLHPLTTLAQSGQYGK